MATFGGIGRTGIADVRTVDTSDPRNPASPSCARRGMVQTPASRSISSHVAKRTSPDRAAVSTRNSNARLVATRGLEGSHGREGVCHRAVGQRPHMLDDGLLPPEGLPASRSTLKNPAVFRIRQDKIRWSLGSERNRAESCS